MTQAKSGDKVKIHYTGKLEDGEVFDASEGSPPLEFTIGSGEVITGFENGVIGMEVGASKTITVPPEEAYGSAHEQLLVTVQRTDFPENITPAVGEQLHLQRPDGGCLNVTIATVDEETVTLDANHPLAGKTLIFDIQLVEIV